MNCKIQGCSEVAIHNGLCLQHYTELEDESAVVIPSPGTIFDDNFQLEVEEAAHDDMQRSISDELDMSAGDMDPFGGGESGGGGASGDF